MAIRRALLTTLLAGCAGVTDVAAAPAPAAPPVKVAITVSPHAIGPGSEVHATVRLVPETGIKLNRYPKIKIQVPAAAGLVAAAEASVGNAGPPSADNLEANYFKGETDPLSVTLRLDPAARRGAHEIAGKLSYFYCVAASGYCAPAKVDVTIPVTVR